ncbi:hypothetical protein M0804_009409 [Polistes exclamans]|nr:hypothetical protein M0804_009409 [Polistes exclamans]
MTVGNTDPVTAYFGTLTNRVSDSVAGSRLSDSRKTMRTSFSNRVRKLPDLHTSDCLLFVATLEFTGTSSHNGNAK